MSSDSERNAKEHLDMVFLYILQALSPAEIPTAEAHIESCSECRQELDTLRPIISGFAAWPSDILRPSKPLWEKLALRVAKETGQEPLLAVPKSSRVAEWEEAAPGISVKLLATDVGKGRVSMLVRLAPGADYPPHCHADEEELHLLHGELMVDDRKLYPGDYLHAPAGTVDHRVWTETGCTCVLITSTEDEIL
jgi:quercetin dioxygenase-like cupin family protein